MYGSVVERADVVIKAKTRKQAMNKAIKQSEKGEISFTENNEAPNGWEYQVEECVKT